MDSLQWYDWVRLVTVLLCVFSLIRIAVGAPKLWGHYTSYTQELLWVLVGSLIFIIVNAFERIVDGNGVHVGFFASFVISAYAFTTTMRKDKLFKEETP